MSRFRALPYAKALLEVIRADHPDRLQAVIEDLDNVRMVERREHPGLADKTSATFGGQQETGLEDLDCSVPLERLVNRLVHGAHRTCTNTFAERIASVEKTPGQRIRNIVTREIHIQVQDGAH